MSKQVLGCPVDHGNFPGANNPPLRYDLITAAAERHITEPGNHYRINNDLRTQLQDHFAVMAQHRPEIAQGSVLRSVRSANLAAFFHIVAEPLVYDDPQVQWTPSKAPYLWKHHKVDWASYDFKHTKFTTGPVREFVNRVTASMIERSTNIAAQMWTPDSPFRKYARLATVTVEDFNEEMTSNNVHPDYKTRLTDWKSRAAEDNATAILDTLVSAGSACRTEQPEADAADMATFALSHLETLGQVASVNGTASAKLSLRHEEKAEGFRFGRKDNVVAYETSLTEGQPFVSPSGTFHTSPRPHWGGSLKNGPWRQPGYCPSWPELPSYRDPNIRFRTITAELGAATLVAQNTIFRYWPA